MKKSLIYIPNGLNSPEVEILLCQAQKEINEKKNVYILICDGGKNFHCSKNINSINLICFACKNKRKSYLKQLKGKYKLIRTPQILKNNFSNNQKFNLSKLFNYKFKKIDNGLAAYSSYVELTRDRDLDGYIAQKTINNLINTSNQLDLKLTGMQGDVMKESATIALAYLKSNAEQLGIDSRLFTSYDINIHVPQGAIPKDGPSAGVTLLTALTSLFTQKKVAPKLAMTGEITLRGKVLPVGGIKEKILAAKRAKITNILLCDKNRKDIEEIEAHYLKGMTFHYVQEMSEVLELAILDQKVKSPKKLEVPAVPKG